MFKNSINLNLQPSFRCKMIQLKMGTPVVSGFFRGIWRYPSVHSEQCRTFLPLSPSPGEM